MVQQHERRINLNDKKDDENKIEHSLASGLADPFSRTSKPTYLNSGQTEEAEQREQDG